MLEKAKKFLKNFGFFGTAPHPEKFSLQAAKLLIFSATFTK
jgi:hypothetical protein